MLEQYWYDVDGGRVKKVSGGTTTYTFFGHYEEEVTNGATTAISHYSFGSLRIAVKRGSTLYHLHGDHLGSTSLTTAGSVVEASRTYYAYGAERAASGTLQTDRTFTGQKSDASGLLYYNARYYDPALGTFISPDTMVPDMGRVIDYNRFLYARGNPLKYVDPNGHEPYEYDPDWHDKDRWYQAHGFQHDPNTRHWTISIPARFRDKAILLDVLNEAGIQVEGADNWWGSGELTLLAQGVVALAQKIAVTKFGNYVAQAGIETGFARLKSLIGSSVTWYRAKGGPGFCAAGDACSLEPYRIGYYKGLFEQGNFTVSEHRDFVRGTAVHELAHKIHMEQVCSGGHRGGCILMWFSDREISLGDWSGYGNMVTGYGFPPFENWAEGVTVWVYGSYLPRPRYNSITPINLTDPQKSDIKGILLP